MAVHRILVTDQIDPEGGVASLREKCQAALLKERDKAVRNNVKQQVMEALLKANDIELSVNVKLLLDHDETHLHDEVLALAAYGTDDQAVGAQLLPAIQRHPVEDRWLLSRLERT